MKGERVKIIFISFFFCFVFGLCFLWINRIQFLSYQKSVNAYVYGVLEVIKKEFPMITEQEVIRILNQENGKYPEVLKKYGIHEGDSVLSSLEQNYKASVRMNLCFLLFSLGCFLFFFFWYYSRKERKIREITNYMREINQKNYFLGIENNEEGELSILWNEVYKTTIMLREESDSYKKEKLALKDSILDISHQLKTPLTSILIMLDNILDNPKMEEKTKMDFIMNVRRQVENIHLLLVSLLKLSRIEANVVDFKKEKIVVFKLLTDAIHNLETLRELKNVTIQIACAKNITFIGDFHWELEAIQNLIKNAIEHSYENGCIELQVSITSLYVQISIQDYGVGMSKKELKNIFKRFYKGENSNSDSVGIGLSLTKKIIEKDNGYIKVESEKGKGTLFEIRYLK